MRRRWVVVFAAGAVALLGTGCTRATPTTTTPVPSTTPVSTAAVVPVAGGPADSWGRAIEVPGLAALDKGGKGDVASVSCGSAVNCAAGGSYLDRHRRSQGFVVSETNGRWGLAIEVPGLGALNTGAFVAEGAEVTSVSCASAGNCAAGGYYSTRPVGDRVRRQAFVASEQNGRWGMAIEVPGIAALNAGHYAEVFSVSCGSEGNCAAGGNAASSAPNINGGGHQQGFVASESNGAWGQAIEVPGLEALNKDGYASVNSVSCAPAGNCVAGGSYMDSHGHFQGFVT